MKVAFEVGNDRIKIIAHISDDKLKLFIDALCLRPPNEGEEPIARDTVVDLLAAQAPRDAINLGVIDDVVAHLNKSEEIKERRIIKGTEPKPGADGKLVFLVKRFTGEPEVSIDERGYARFRELNLFENITVGTIVARLYPPKAGEDGLDVFGKKIAAAAGKPFKLNIDKTLQLGTSPKAEDPFQVIVAQCEGYLADDKGALSIREELVISGNLDFHVGNIDFIGAVRIKGDVLPGFMIQAKKGISISGSVRGATLRCSEGDIEIKGFVHGGEGGKIVGGREIRAHVMQQVLAEAIGNIVVKKEAIDCTLRSQAAVFIPTGSLVGGETLVVCGAEAKFLGNEVGHKTSIQLVSDMEMSTEYATLQANIESHDKALKLIELHLGPYVKVPERISLLKEPYRSKMSQLHRKHAEVHESRISLLAKKQKLLEGAHSNSVLRVNFLGNLYEEVYIAAGEDVYRSVSVAAGPASLDYIPDEHQFKIGEYKALECTVRGSQAPPTNK